MKFYITSTECEGDELLKKYPWLKDYGYENDRITVNTLEEIMDIVGKSGDNNGVILLTSHYEKVDGKYQDIREPTIEIYDGYRE